MAKMSVTIKIKKRFKLYVKFIAFLYFIRLNTAADKLFYSLMDGIEEDLNKFVTIE